MTDGIRIHALEKKKKNVAQTPHGIVCCESQLIPYHFSLLLTPRHAIAGNSFCPADAITCLRQTDVSEDTQG